MPFTDEAIDAIALWSHGIPRLINAICDNALLIAFAETNQNIDVRLVREACSELDLPTPAVKSRSKPIPIPVPTLQAVSQPGPIAVESPRQSVPSFWEDSRPSLLKKWLRMGS